jgi:hypothetical protein
VKLSEVLLRPEARVPDMTTVHFKSEKGHALSLDGGIVSISRTDERTGKLIDDPPWLFPLASCIRLRAAVPEPKADGSAKR